MESCFVGFQSRFFFQEELLCHMPCYAEDFSVLLVPFYLSRNISAVLVLCTRSWCPLMLDLTPTQIQMTTLVLKFGISCRSLLTSHGYRDDCRLNMVALIYTSSLQGRNLWVKWEQRFVWNVLMTFLWIKNSILEFK